MEKKKVPKKEVGNQEIAALAKQLLINLKREKKEDLIDKTKKILEYPAVKEVLALLGAGSFLVLSAAVPSLPALVKPVLDKRSSREWKKYNYWYLLRTLKRLKKQKVVRFKTDGDKTVVELTIRGKKKILKYSLAEMEIKKPKIWDRKWRLIIYDVPKRKRRAADDLNQMLQNLGMHRLQKSVFICPFPCDDEVKFLREFFGIGDNVWILTVSSFENDKVFKDYFGL